ncbi:MAG: terminase gpA endonuclease subunit [Phycisphaeraceae bacterium]
MAGLEFRSAEFFLRRLLGFRPVGRGRRPAQSLSRFDADLLVRDQVRGLPPATGVLGVNADGHDLVGHLGAVRFPNTTGKRQVRHVLVDTNYWKTFVHARLAVAVGDPGCLSLPGRDEKVHRLLADHLTAEYRVKASAQGRTVDEWKLRATRPDNHWLDCLVGCAVAASIQGATLAGVESVASRTRQRVKLSELQRGRR